LISSIIFPNLFKYTFIIISIINDNNGDWGLGIGDWGLGPIPNPQSPIIIINISNIFIK